MQSTSSPIMQSGGELGGGRRVKVEPPRGTENPGRESCKGEWRCTTISTGSSPGPEDDVVSCHCITHG